MNNRLVEQYKDIRNSNLQRFIHNEIEIDTTWGKDVWGVTLQIELGEKVKDLITKFQNELSSLESHNLWLLPRQFQHISFNQVIFWGGNYSKGKENTWNSIREEFITKFKSLDKNFSSFGVYFSDFIATTGGIILCGYDDNDELENLRSVLHKRLPFPSETTKLNHIIHTTVARYKNKLKSPDRVYDFIQKQTEKAQMIVNKITLKIELVFPSIKTENIAEIELISL